MALKTQIKRDIINIISNLHRAMLTYRPLGQKQRAKRSYIVAVAALCCSTTVLDNVQDFVEISNLKAINPIL